MMQKSTITTTALVFTFILGGMTACNHSNSSPSSQSEASPATTSQAPSTTNNPQSAERAQKRQTLRKQIEAIMTPEQLQQLQKRLQAGDKMRKALKSLDLTANQKAKIHEIFKTAHAQQNSQEQSQQE